LDRRRFFQSVSLGAAALGAPPLSTAPGALGAPAESRPGFPVPPGVDYFKREELDTLVNTSVSIDGIKFQVVCINFPAWHPSPAQERYFGKRWTEWETLKHAKPNFDGHLQPKRPLWGYYNDADPVWAEREIELAASSGIDAFLVDFYWHEGSRWYHEQLEQGFLRAPNRRKLHFAIMWANHDWTNDYPAPESLQGAVLYPQTYSDADMDRLADYLIEHYMRESNYWQISGQPVLGIYDVLHLLKSFGEEKLRRALDRMKERAARAGLKGMHLQASSIYVPGQTPLKDLGFDSATHYHPFAGGPPGETSEYAAAVRKTIATWRDTASKLELPYFPDCPSGWDDSPREGTRAHVYIHRSPDQFESLMLAAKYFVAERQTSPPVVFLSSWNEWTEDHRLLPDDVYGYSYLEAVRRQFPPVQV
jgi:hypothetical protein